MSIRDKLKRLESHTGLRDHGTHKESSVTQHQVPNQEQWDALDSSIRWLDQQYIIVREVNYPIDSKHGTSTFSTLKQAVSAWNHTSISHPLSAKGLRMEDLIFFDTETTGLYTGAGHHIFLIGFAQVKDSRVYVTQYLLPGPEAEAALYYHFLSDVSNLSHLVTYNGKAFDWPQVKTRHSFVRKQVPKLPAFGHFDLLHAARRLWKNELPSCKLTIVEEEKLGFKRQHDTPSYMVPMLYFDFVREQTPELVEGILKHHEWDLLSLITLYSELSFQMLDGSLETQSANESYEVGRWFATIGEDVAAEHFLNKAIKYPSETKAKSMFEIANLKKKQKNAEQALLYFKESYDAGYRKLDAAIECAKIFEHTFKQIEDAIHFTQKAMEDIDLSSKMGHELEKRLSRLRKKQE